MPACAGRRMRETGAPGARLLGRRAGIGVGVGLVLTALAIGWLGEFSDLDLLLADQVFDTAAGVFPWRHAWLTETFNHLILKGLFTLAALAVIGAALVDRRDALARLRLRVVALAAVLVPLAISLLKQASVSHCPWDLARYGGSQPYLRLFDALPAGVAAGHCMPAGHASSALWLTACAVLWLPASPGKAGMALLVALGVGAATGWLQQMRGAHFLTHTLWSMWIGCAIVYSLILALQPYSGKR